MAHHTIKSNHHHIEAPLKDLNCGDIVEIIDESETCVKAVAIEGTSCRNCPLFSGRICEFYWESSNGMLHGACESKASVDDSDAKDIRFQKI